MKIYGSVAYQDDDMLVLAITGLTAYGFYINGTHVDVWYSHSPRMDLFGFSYPSDWTLIEGDYAIL